MLNALRSSAGSIVIKGLLVLLALSFMVWGVTDYIGGGASGGAVAKVGETRVEPVQFLRALDQDVTRLRSVFGPTFTREQARALGVVDQTIGRLVGEALVAEESTDLGVAVDDEIVRRNVTRDPTFQGLVGGFDRDRFRQIAQSLGYSEQGLLERIRSETARDQVLSAPIGALTAPDSLVAAIAQHRLQTRTIAFVELPRPEAAAIAAPTDSDLRAYFDANADGFTIPERRAVTFVPVAVEALAETIDVTDADLTEAFEVRKDSYLLAQQRRVRQMILADESAANAAKARLDGGEEFAAVASDAAGMDDAATDLGLVTPDGLLPELSGPVFQLAEGQSTAPVQSAFGWHVVQVSEILGGAEPVLDDVRDELTAELKRERAADEVYAVSTELEDAIAAGATLEEASNRLNLPLERVESLARDGSDGRGAPVTGLPGDGRAFIEEAFQSDTGIPSILVETGDDGYFVLRVETVAEPEIPAFEAVRGDVEDAVRAGRAAEAATAQAEALYARIAGGTALTEIAAELGGEVRVSPPLRRDGQVDTTNTLAPDIENVPGRGLIAEAFDAAEGAAIVAETGGRFQLGRVASVVAPSGAAGAHALAGELSQAMQNDVLAAFSAALQDKHTVDIYPGVVETLLTPHTGGGY